MILFDRYTRPRFASNVLTQVVFAAVLLAAALIAPPVLWAQTVTPQALITTVAGLGWGGYNGDSIPASTAALYMPWGIAVDASGNIYIADTINNRIRKVSAATGVITTVVGNGTAGYNGDNIPATSAELNTPRGVAFDHAGNLYIADSGNQRIRMVSATTGSIITVAGNGVNGYGGENTPPTATPLSLPMGVVVDAAGNVYIADTFNHRIREISAATGVITTVAGNGTAGYNGDNILATSAELNAPGGVAVDAAGNVYIADTNNSLVRRVDASTHVITSVTGVTCPAGVTLDAAGNLYIAGGSSTIVLERSASTGVISTVAGTGTFGYNGDNIPATNAELGQPAGVAVDALGNLYISDAATNRVRMVQSGSGNLGSVNVGQSSHASPVGFSFTSSRQVGSIAVLTQGASGMDFQAVPSGSCVPGVYSAGSSCTVNVVFSPLAPGTRNGAVVLYDTSKPLNVVGSVALTGTGIGPAIGFGPGMISTVAGTGTVGYNGDNIPATNAWLSGPRGVAMDGSGNLYIADNTNHRIRKVSAATGTITTVAGNGIAGYNGDNIPATSAWLSNPGGVAVDGSGNLYVADFGSQRIRKVSAATGTITTVAGNGTGGYNGDSIPATRAELYGPTSVAVDSSGNLYIADDTNNRIRKVNAATGIITTVAGNGISGYNGDNIPATSAELNSPIGVTVDGSGNLYIAEYGNRVRRVDAAMGTITTIAGNGTAGYNGDNIPATSAELGVPSNVTVDSSGSLYIADLLNNRIRRVNAATGIITTVAGNGISGYNGDNVPATSAELNSPIGVTVDSSGNLYIADYGNRIRKVDVADAPSLTFGTTYVGSASAEQDVLVENVGNAPLNISQISTAANFVLGSDTSCADNGQLLNPSETCVLGIEFAPQSAGSISGSVVLTDNAQNELNSTQSILLSGTGSSATIPTTTSILTNLSSQGSSSPVAIYGEPVTLTAGITWTQAEVAQPGGSVTFFDGGTQIGIASLTQFQSTLAQAVLNLSGTQLSVGTHNLLAVYTGDSNYQGSTGTLSVTVATYGSPASIAVVSGTPQSASAGYAFASPLTVLVVDQYNNPVPGVTVTFAAPSSGASATLSATSATTGSNGRASVTATANTSGGNYNVSAAIGNGTFANFVLSNVVNNAQSLGSAQVGSSASTTLSFSVTTAAVPNLALKYGLEFAAGTLNCAGTGTLTCTVTLTFQPQYPGVRTDAMRITDGAGNLLQTTLLSGIGQAPLVAMIPGLITTVAGNGTGAYNGDNIPATSAGLNFPSGVAVDVAGNVYVSEQSNNRVRRIDAISGAITTVAGNGTYGYNGDNVPSTSAELSSPMGVAVDGAGNLYIADTFNNRIRKVDATSGVITTVAGNGSCIVQTPYPTYECFNGDNVPATSAELYSPYSVAVDGAGNLYIADTSNQRVRMVSAATGLITTVAGNGNYGYNGENISATSASLYGPKAIALDSSGNIYIAESANSRVRKISAATGLISTVAGNGYSGSMGDGGPASDAVLDGPSGVAVDAAGNVYIADDGPSAIRKVSAATGIITSVVGGSTNGYNGDNIASTRAELYYPRNIAIDSVGNLYIADTTNRRIRKVTATAAPISFPQTFDGSVSTAQTFTAVNIGNSPLSFSGIAASVNFTVDSGTTTCSNSSVVAVGDSCQLGVVFAPTAIGNLSGTLALTDNALNADGASQQIQLSGTGLAQLSQTIAFSNPGPQTYGVAPVTLTGTATSGLPVSYSVTGPASISGSILTITGAGTVTVTAMQAGNSTYLAASQVVQSFTVSAAAPTITKWPSASAISVRQTLASSTLSGGTASLPGSFAFTTPTTAPPMGTAAQTVTFTPTDVVDYTTVSGSVNVAVYAVGVDLIETGVSAPALGGAGDVIQVTDTAMNQGIQSASNSGTYYYLATSATATTGTYLGARIVPSLASGVSNTATTSVTLPTGIAGKYYVVACANVSRTITESNTSNNCSASSVVTVATPDLSESAVSASGSFTSGGAITVTDSVTNLAAAIPPSSATAFYLATSATATTGTYLGSRTVPSLAQNASSTATTSLTLPSNLSGTYYVVACANANFGGTPFPESNKTNNCLASSSVTVATPDLDETSVSVSGSFTSGEAITVTDSVINLAAAVPPTSGTAFYLATSATATSGTYLGSRTVPALTQNGSSTTTTSLTLPSGIGGTYYIIACANANFGGTPFPESNKANNCLASSSVTVATPDLDETSVSVSGSLVSGGAITVTDSVTNLTAAVPPVSGTAFYLATSATATSRTYLGSRTVPGLAQNVSSTATTSLTLPNALSGTYYVIACANVNFGGTPFPESNKTNNCAASVALIVSQ